MKLSNPTAIKWVSLLISGVVRAWMSTLDMRFSIHSQSQPLAAGGRKNIYLFWHEMILFPLYAYARFRLGVLVSRHRDGELIAQVLRMFRGVSVRGSSDRDGRNRGGAAAVRKLLSMKKANHFSITPDGPRGPRRVVQEGAIYLASRSGMPLVASGLAFDRPWRVSSWDRMALPRPFSRAVCVVGEPIIVPKDLDRDGIAEYRIKVQQAMDRAQDIAERLAQGQHCPDVPTLQSKSRTLVWPEKYD